MLTTFQAVTIPPEVLALTDSCEIDLSCTHTPHAMIITETDSFYVCYRHLQRMNQVNKMFDYLEN